MPKGKTSAPLRIAVYSAWLTHPAIEVLIAQGHGVAAYPEPANADLILHPAAHNWSEPMFVEDEKKDGTKHRPYLNAALSAARARKRGQKRA